MVAAILGTRSGVAIAGTLVADTLVVGTLVAGTLVVFRAVTGDKGAEVDLAVLLVAADLVAVPFVAADLAVLLVAADLVAVPFVAVLFVAVGRPGATFLAATVALAAVARTALTTLAAVVSAGVTLAVPFEDGAVLSAGPPFFADIAFCTAILDPFKVAVDRPRERGQVA